MTKKPKELTKKELATYDYFLTVGRLKEFLKENKLPDNALVLIQRIEDVYYEEHGWGVYLKEGEDTGRCKQWNKDIKSGKYLNKKQYPKIKKENLKPFTKEQIKQSMEQYHPAFCCTGYKNDKDILFINLHY